MICETCGKEFFEDWRRDKYTKLKNPVPRFCSKACANSRKHSEETKSLISKSVKETLSQKSEEEKEKRKKRFIETCKRHRMQKQVTLDNGLKLDITNGELEEYKKAHFVCEICGNEEARKDISNLARDHQHGTNHFRGLLCSSCNYKLGWFERRREKILTYLDERNI